MCGIAGVSLKKANLTFQKKFSKVFNYLKHRGPDGKGAYKKKNVELLHTRLSIVDLDGGAQPIINDGVVLIANGEIYNDLNLRKKISKYKYKTNSDSESIIAVYKEDGIEGFKRLRGMYSFSLFDQKKGITFIGRDVFGIKPLYFSIFEEGIIYSSEMQSIQRLNIQNNDLSQFKLREYFQLQYCSGKKTIYNNIQRVRPGETIVIEDGKIIKSQLERLPTRKKNKKINDEYIFDKIKESVSVHLRSDVPYCLFYSGGIDSTLIMYFMKELNLNKEICAYNVNIDNTSCNEAKITDEISKSFNIELNQISFSENDFWNTLPFAAKHIDEPVADYAIIPTFKMAGIASKKFKVALTGEGGDELFGGYGRYKKMKSFYKGAFRKLDFLDQKDWDFDIKFFENQISDLSKLQKYQFFDYINWLPNNLLVKLDRCLMAYGMEGRTPLIDKEIFENFFYIDDSFKQKNGYGKFLIRQFLNKRVTNYNSFSKKKGFTVPIKKWIPKKAKYLQKILPKMEILRYFFKEDDIFSLCKGVTNNDMLVRPLWHMIFISVWYAINIKKVKTKGDFFDVISSSI